MIYNIIVSNCIHDHLQNRNNGIGAIVFSLYFKFYANVPSDPLLMIDLFGNQSI